MPMNRSLLHYVILIAGSALLATGIFLSLGKDGGDFFMPHAHCYLFNRELMMLHGGSDFLIGLAYVAISATLVWLVYRARRELPFHWMMLAFATFIVACGATHFMEVWTLNALDPRYWLSGWVKLITAIASVTTALVLPPLVPRILSLMESARLSAEHREKLERAYVELNELYSKVKQMDQMKTSFFANVSHELRTPLALIFSPVDRMLQSKPDPATRRELIVVRRNALLLYKHVNDLLDVSKL
ncbi:MAG: histidine kinase, partial [Chthoniobacter sp. 12-60-6]